MKMEMHKNHVKANKFHKTSGWESCHVVPTLPASLACLDASHDSRSRHRWLVSRTKSFPQASYTICASSRVHVCVHKHGDNANV